MALVVGPMEPATKRGRPVGELVGGLARQFRGGMIQLVGVSCRSYSARTMRRAAEGIGLDDVGAGLEDRRGGCRR